MFEFPILALLEFPKIAFVLVGLTCFLVSVGP